MKFKIIIFGLALLTLLLSDRSATAQHHNEEALQQTAREIYGPIMCPLCAGQTIAQSNKEYYYVKEEKKGSIEKTYH